jgi:prevent-host-death family protein
MKIPNEDSKPASTVWQVQTAKARFSEVFRLARTAGPQRITRQGKEGVVMISEGTIRAPHEQITPA